MQVVVFKSKMNFGLLLKSQLNRPKHPRNTITGKITFQDIKVSDTFLYMMFLIAWCACGQFRIRSFLGLVTFAFGSERVNKKPTNYFRKIIFVTITLELYSLYQSCYLDTFDFDTK